MYICDLILNLLAIHLGEGEVAEDAPEVLAVDGACVPWVVEGKGVLDLVLLDEMIGTISSDSLLFNPAALLPLAFDMFFFTNGLLISYKNIIYFKNHRI